MFEAIHLATLLAVWMAAAPAGSHPVQQNPPREQRWQQLTQFYAFTSARLAKPRIADPHLGQDVESLRMEIARLTGAAPDTVRLVASAFSADAKPDVSIDVSGGVTYHARFCRYDAMGTPHIEVDETFSSEGATIFVGREIGKEAFVLVVRDYLAPMTTDIVEIQDKLDLEMQKASGEQDRPTIALAMYPRYCPRDLKE